MSDMSSMSAYFATAYLLRCSVRAISNHECPATSIDRISFTVSKGTIIILILLERARQSNHRENHTARATPRRNADARSQPFFGQPEGSAREKTGFGRARRTENRNAAECAENPEWRRYVHPREPADISLPGKRRLDVQRARALPAGNERARLKTWLKRTCLLTMAFSCQKNGTHRRPNRF